MLSNHIKKGLLCVLLFVVVSLSMVLGGASVYFLNYALAPVPDRHHTEAHFSRFRREHPEAVQWLDSMQCVGALRDTFLLMPSGERHHALLACHPEAHGRVAVVVHGWRDTSIKFLHLAHIYHHFLGFNVLLPDLCAHGLSEGSRIGMGWRERTDVLRWMQAAHESWQSHTFVLHGVSMGAATVMNVSGEVMPSFVQHIRFVEDCGYTSVWDEFAHEMKNRFSLPAFPLLHTANLLNRLCYGWDFADASSLQQVSRSPYPMLFIHGARDNFVPTWMVHSLYKAKQGPKTLWITPDCGHNDSYRFHTSHYIRRVCDFVNTIY